MSDGIEIMRSAIRKYGRGMQTVVAIEELSELQKELSKCIRGKENKKDLTEEVADVLVMITQIQLMYHIPDEDVESVIQFKLERLQERMMKNENT